MRSSTDFIIDNPTLRYRDWRWATVRERDRSRSAGMAARRRQRTYDRRRSCVSRPLRTNIAAGVTIPSHMFTAGAIAALATVW